MFPVLCPASLNWMFKHFLQLIDSEIVIIIPSGPNTSSINNLHSRLGALSNNVEEETHNLGVNFLTQQCILMFKIQEREREGGLCI